MRRTALVLATLTVFPWLAHGQQVLPAPTTFIPELVNPPGTGPALSPRVSQDDILSMTLKEIRAAGRRVFSTPFNLFDGMGDGPINLLDPTMLGGRPTVGDNGVFMRVHGLDSQTCLECHSVLSNRDIPSTFAVGGVGGIAATAFAGPTEFDVDDEAGNGFAFYDGRLINPPFIWGSGGVELAGKEMTADLQALKQSAMDSPNTVIPLFTKGVSFGTISYDGTVFDTSNVEGVATDLVVRPFGRKGDNSSIRKFDTGALAFHHGMQAEEITDDLDSDGIPDDGVDMDPDGDGVFNEILPGELSAMHVFQALSRKPRETPGNNSQLLRGRQNFGVVGCAACHVPELETDTRFLPVAFPEIETDPTSNVFLSADLLGGSAGFKGNGQGGILVPLFSDLKIHNVGTSDPTGAANAGDFITARLWGIADTAPYMHNGSALTLTDAIGAHGGEAAVSAAAFGALPSSDQIDLLAFLDTLRAPKNPNKDL